MFRKDASHDFETKDQVFEVKTLEQTGEIEGYASVFGNLDQGGDIVDEAAFDKDLSRWAAGASLPKMLWQHDPGQPIGVWTQAQKDATGLRLKGRLLLDIPLAKTAHTLLLAKAIDGLSIGFRTREADREENGARRLKDLALMETSVVTFPMNTSATVEGVKKLHSIRDVERILRDAGVPNSFAKTVALKGFEAAEAEYKGIQRDAGSDAEEKLRSLHEKLTQLKEKIRA